MTTLTIALAELAEKGADVDALARRCNSWPSASWRSMPRRAVAPATTKRRSQYA